MKIFKLADPIQNSELFELANKQINLMEKNNQNIDKYKTLIKLYDQVDIINDII